MKKVIFSSLLVFALFSTNAVMAQDSKTCKAKTECTKGDKKDCTKKCDKKDKEACPKGEKKSCCKSAETKK